MAHTNSTANYNLPQFISSDKPGWLTDVNTAYYDIDAAMHANSVAAASASSVASNAQIDASTALTTANNAGDFQPGDQMRVTGIFIGVSTAGGGTIQFSITLPKRSRSAIASSVLSSATVSWIHGEGNSYTATDVTIGRPSADIITFNVTPTANVPGNKIYGINLDATLDWTSP